MRLALQVLNLAYPEVDEADLFETVATVAEASGFDTVLVRPSRRGRGPAARGRSQQERER